ncbi:MAG: hypothetical protein RB191_24980, partial [Terriglobia bacterium]|nr:hypothetical protein [Terriglobia bacterium]
MANISPKLKGLFDRPISSPIDANNPLVKQAIARLHSAYQEGDGGTGFADCPPGYLPNAYGGCDADPTSASNSGGGGGSFAGGDGGGSSTTVIDQTGGPVSVTVNNAVNVTDTGIQQISDQITQAIQNTAQQTQQLVDNLNKSIVSNIQEESDSIQSAVKIADVNLADQVSITTAALATSTAATIGTTAKSISDEISAVKDTITPILTSITGFIDKISAEVQQINDSFVQPLLNVYQSTIGTIATLTTAIEQDLHDGISGLLKIPGQLADQLGSFDATLDRTVQQLGKTNLETSKSTVDYFGQQIPKPLGDAMSKALAGVTLSNQLTTTFTNSVAITSESLAAVSSEAIGGIGNLLKEMLHILASTFESSFNQLHADWSSVGSAFVGLLDGALGLLTTLTAMGALASPLIDAAEQEARALVPTTKLDPATVIQAMKRGFLSADAGLKEMQAKGLDATRVQVLTDLGVFLADVNQALDWWYRGIISDTDLEENILAHGITAVDGAAIKAASVNLPNASDLLRWLNFGIISQDQFSANMKVIRYDDAQIQAILSTYQEHETPQTLSTLDGLLNNSSAGFLNSTLNIPVPDTVALAGQRAGYHPDLTRYIWLNHWQLPSVEQFIQAYFRGLRTRTEVEQRMEIANIPRELWDDVLKTNSALIPYRSIPSFITNGWMTPEQGQAELAAHGFDLAHQELILKAVKPPKDTTNATAANAIHTLSVANARELWSEQA